MLPSASDDQLNIDTPENVTFGYRVAGIGSRFLAALVDSTLIGVLILSIYFLFWLLLYVLSQLPFPETPSGEITNTNADQILLWLAAALGLVAFALFWSYYMLFELLWNGQTPGKRWLGLRVIRTDGAPITLAEAVIRNLVRLVDFMPAYYGVGVVTMFINRQARRLGDLAAGTMVVHDRAIITLASLALQAPAPIANDSRLPFAHLSSQDVALAEDFLRRREQFVNRADLAVKIAQALEIKLGQPATQMSAVQAEAFLAEIVRANAG